jgi:hypothetical protein
MYDDSGTTKTVIGEAKFIVSTGLSFRKKPAVSISLKFEFSFVNANLMAPRRTPLIFSVQPEAAHRKEVQSI